MKHVRRHDDVRVADPAASVPAAAPDPDVLRLRMLHRAAAELRRGTPVLLTGEAPLVLLAAETAGPRGLASLRAAWPLRWRRVAYASWRFCLPFAHPRHRLEQRRPVPRRHRNLLHLGLGQQMLHS